jgi:serine/threonine-protein kinase
MGTPLYMSPEQCRDSAAIDFRTDLYSLGCVLHEMLTGRPPFHRDNFGDLMVAHITEPPPDARAANPSVPAPLAELTGELLRKDPAARPASMRVVADRLMTYVARMTTVPGSAASAPSSSSSTEAPVANAHAPAAPRAVRTTFGASASELASPTAAPARARSPAMIGVAIVVIAGGAVAATLALKRGPERAAAPAPVAAVIPVAAPAPAAAPPPTAPPPAAREAAPHLPPAAASAPSIAAGASAPAMAAAASKKKGAHHLASSAVASSGEAAAAPAAAAPAGLPGTWEGPWSDHAHGQQGRFFLQLAPNGSVAGWMTNAAAKQSYRMAGTFTPAGALELACQCPRGQEFSARGAVHADAAGELKGELSLTAASGVFGQSRLSLRRSSAPR